MPELPPVMTATLSSDRDIGLVPFCRYGLSRLFRWRRGFWLHAHPSRCVQAHATVSASRLRYAGGYEGARVEAPAPLPGPGEGVVRSPLCPRNGHRADGRGAVGAVQDLLQRVRDSLLALRDRAPVGPS